MDTFGILTSRPVKTFFQKNTWNPLAGFIGLDILAQLKSTPFAKRDPGDD
jgi:hypothetical protein